MSFMPHAFAYAEKLPMSLTLHLRLIGPFSDVPYGAALLQAACVPLS